MVLSQGLQYLDKKKKEKKRGSVWWGYMSEELDFWFWLYKVGTGDQLAANDDGFGGGDLDGVNQRFKSKVGIDKSAGDANLGQPHPHAHEVRPRLHQQGDCIPALKTNALKIVGHLVTSFVDLGKGKYDEKLLYWWHQKKQKKHSVLVVLCLFVVKMWSWNDETQFCWFY